MTQRNAPDPGWMLSDIRDSGCTLSPLLALLLGIPPDSPRIAKPREASGG